MIHFDNSYARMPEGFFARVAPTPVAEPRLLALNEGLARRLGLDAGWLSGPEGVAMLAGNALPQGADPIAQAYAGHQFGHFVPQLGDGRSERIDFGRRPVAATHDVFAHRLDVHADGIIRSCADCHGDVLPQLFVHMLLFRPAVPDEFVKRRLRQLVVLAELLDRQCRTLLFFGSPAAGAPREAVRFLEPV